jgi:hypothetical protein
MRAEPPPAPRPTEVAAPEVAPPLAEAEIFAREASGARATIFRWNRVSLPGLSRAQAPDLLPQSPTSPPHPGGSRSQTVTAGSLGARELLDGAPPKTTQRWRRCRHTSGRGPTSPSAAPSSLPRAPVKDRRSRSSVSAAAVSSCGRFRECRSPLAQRRARHPASGNEPPPGMSAYRRSSAPGRQPCPSAATNRHSHTPRCACRGPSDRRRSTTGAAGRAQRPCNQSRRGHL